MAPNLVGTQLGKYQLRAEIGRGGMGTVYLGYDPMLDRKVAIKVLAPHLVWEPGFVERFLREARSAARLRHPNIVTIYDVGQQEDRYYIVMEYLAGQTLAQYIAQGGPFSSKHALPVLSQLADALDYAHRQGLIHRDVKPGNVIVAGDGRATLTDFGVARAVQETRLTATGSIVGTPQYMSPEQARGDPVDHRSDLYSLGVVAYEMLTGRTPFAATTPHAVLHKLIYEAPPPLRSLRPDLPPAVETVMARALSKEPDARYQTAREMIAALEGALTAPAGQQAELPPTVAAAPPSPRQGEREPPAPPAAADAAPPATNRLWLWWLLVGVLGWAVGWNLGLAVGDFVGIAFGPGLPLAAVEVLTGAVTWAILGLIFGLGQWLVLRRYLPRVGGWVLATGLGLTFLGAVKWLQGPTMDAILRPLWRAGLDWPVPIFSVGLATLFEGASGLVLGTAQWFVLRRRVDWAGQWPWINALAWAVVAPAIGLLTWLLGELPEWLGLRLLPLVGSVIVALITGLGLARLLRKGEGVRP